MEQIRGMEEFFNSVSVGYDEHMREVIKDYDKFYKILASPIERSDAALKILDLGCGTGAELKDILLKCPDAQFTCVDIAEEMLKLLVQKYQSNAKQLTLIHSPYETVELVEMDYHYVVCAACLHHYPYQRKLKFFKKIFGLLRRGGAFIEGDFFITPAQEREDLEKYNQLVAEFPEIEHGNYHVDATNSIPSEIKVFADAGFQDIDVIYKEGNPGILIGRKG
jgi:tRNA (cmo5U34)-methyltransferase